MTSSHIAVTVEDRLARLEFRRPEKRNAITPDMWTALVASLKELGEHADLRGLMITGAGAAFSAGADLSFIRDDGGAESARNRELAENGLRAVWDFPKPTIALIDGPCIGAGCLLALACDVRFATVRSTFAIPSAKYGLLAEANGLTRLVELVGTGQANRFMLAADTWTAPQALACGLIEVCSDDAASQAADFLTNVVANDSRAVLATRLAIREASSQYPQAVHANRVAAGSSA